MDHGISGILMNVSRDYLYNQYHGEQKTLREIGALLGLSHCTVLKLMRKNNILTNRAKGPKSKRFTMLCEQCHKPTVRVPSTQRTHSFCSHACYSKWMAINIKGENSNNWQGGITAISSDNLKTPEFRAVKKIVLKNFPECVMCGDEEHLHVHHIKTRRKAPELTFSESNLITLCRSCHASIKGSESDWEELFTSVLN